jgi:N12 class adenine-specific DNA methylase/SAM-dependent methyltransferase
VEASTGLSPLTDQNDPDTASPPAAPDITPAVAEVEEVAAEDVDGSEDEVATVEGIDHYDDVITVISDDYGWSLTEEQPDEYGGLTQRWDRGSFALALVWTPADRLASEIYFYDESRWDQARGENPWQPEPIATREQFIRVLAEAGNQGVVVPSYEPGRWKLTATLTVEQAQDAVRTIPAARMVTRDGDRWCDAATEQVLDVVDWMPPLRLPDRNSVLAHVLEPVRDQPEVAAAARPLVLNLITGRARPNIPVGPAAVQAELESLVPADVLARTLAAAAGRSDGPAAGFAAERAQEALQRLAEHDPALPANAVGCLVEVAGDDLLTGPENGTIRGRVTEVVAEGNTALVRIARSVLGPEDRRFAALNVSYDAALTVLALPGHEPDDAIAAVAPDPEPTTVEQVDVLDATADTSPETSVDAAIAPPPEPKPASAPEPAPVAPQQAFPALSEARAMVTLPQIERYLAMTGWTEQGRWSDLSVWQHPDNTRRELLGVPIGDPDDYPVHATIEEMLRHLAEVERRPQAYESVWRDLWQWWGTPLPDMTARWLTEVRPAHLSDYLTAHGWQPETETGEPVDPEQARGDLTVLWRDPLGDHDLFQALRLPDPAEPIGYPSQVIRTIRAIAEAEDRPSPARQVLRDLLAVTVAEPDDASTSTSPTTTAEVPQPAVGHDSVLATAQDGAQDTGREGEPAADQIPAEPQTDAEVPRSPHEQEVLAWLERAGIAAEYAQRGDNADTVRVVLGEERAEELMASPGWPGLDALLIAAENRFFDLDYLLLEFDEPGISAEALRLAMAVELRGDDTNPRFVRVPEELLAPAPAEPTPPTPEPANTNAAPAGTAPAAENNPGDQPDPAASTIHVAGSDGGTPPIVDASTSTSGTVLAEVTSAPDTRADHHAENQAAALPPIVEGSSDTTTSPVLVTGEAAADSAGPWTPLNIQPTPTVAPPSPHEQQVMAWLARAGIEDEFANREDNALLLRELGDDAATALMASPGWPGLDAALIAAENRGFDTTYLVNQFYRPGIYAEEMRLAMASELRGDPAAGLLGIGLPEALLVASPPDELGEPEHDRSTPAPSPDHAAAPEPVTVTDISYGHAELMSEHGWDRIAGFRQANTGGFIEHWVRDGFVLALEWTVDERLIAPISYYDERTLPAGHVAERDDPPWQTYDVSTDAEFATLLEEAGRTGIAVPASGPEGEDQRWAVTRTVTAEDAERQAQADPDARVTLNLGAHWHDADTPGSPRLPLVGDPASPAPPEHAAASVEQAAPIRFQPSSQDDLAPSGEITRIRANLAAIRIRNTLTAEHRPPTTDEQAELARWSGWGACARVFKTTDASLEWARVELRELLTEEEYDSAQRNTLNAHYTDIALTSAIWDALGELGFTGEGTVLEPGCGSGNFLAGAPHNAQVIGVELDPVTADIAAALYPDAQIRSESFADTRIPDGTFDVTVGNIPFGQFSLVDRRHNRGEHRIHDHFILKSLHLTKPGGVVALITSRYTLDKANPAARREIAEMADFLGAVRLPSRTHQRAAGTSAVTDVVLFRRREPDMEPDETAWERSIPVTVNGYSIPINSYFVEHPEQIIGELRSGDGSGMYRRDDLAVVLDDLSQVPQHLAQALGRIVEHARDAELTFAPQAATDAGPVALVRADSTQQEGYIAVAGAGFTRVENGALAPFEVPATQAAEMRALLGLRDTVVELLETEARHRDDIPEIDELRARLNRQYDAYVTHPKYGPINRFTWARTGHLDKETGEEKLRQTRPPVWRLFRLDAFAASVAALEHFEPDTQTAQKADIFTTRVVAPRLPKLGADTAADALTICLDEHAEVRLEVIARLLGVEPDTAREQLGTLVFTEPGTGTLIPAADYLSGNVRDKLDALLELGVDESSPYWPNALALREVIPADLEPEEIHAQLGASWIPVEDVQQFFRELFHDPDFRVEYGGGSMWRVQSLRTHGVQVTQIWGTPSCPGPELAQCLLDQKPPIAYDRVPKDGGGYTRVPNAEKTAEAQAKATEIAERFGEWVWDEPARAKRLAAIYNKLFNGLVLRSYDGTAKEMPGLAVTFKPRPHQHAAVARIVNEPATLLAHEVGAGKTAEMVIGAMECRRLKLAAKPMVVVPNHMLEQFAREWKQLYPRAKLLLATKEDFAGPRRREFVARCATGDWDAVVITYSSFERIPMSKPRIENYLASELRSFEAMLERARARKDQMLVKDIQAARIRAEERIKAKLAGIKDVGLTFENTGCDMLFFDEAHYLKNLRTPSGIPDAAVEGVQKASDAHMKIGYVRDELHGKVVFATATPIANTVTEAEIMQRYLRPDLLHAARITDFDLWAGTFGQHVTAVEMSPAGDKFRLKTRFAKFRNVPELLRMWHVSADIKTAEDLDLEVPALQPRPSDGKRQAEIVSIPASPELSDYIGDLAERAEDIRNRKPRTIVNSKGELCEDNMLLITSDGRAAALDPKLKGIHTNARVKLDVVAEKVYEIWLETRDNIYPVSAEKGAPEHPRRGAMQMVFSDLGTPKVDEWNVYDDLRERLVAMGMPRKAIRFVHEANNDQQKGQLFAACRAGEVAVLLGSTQKAGVGLNAQLRMYALHHLDCPWRPADVQQRDGRILRQGNANPEVRILRYVTEGSFDAYMWQTVARKAEFIAQIMRGKLDVREIEDIGDRALSYNEVRALATGNMLLLEQAEAKAELTRLERAQRSHDRVQARLEHTISDGEKELPRLGQRRDALAELLAARTTTRGDAFAITIKGQRFTERAAGGAALQALLVDKLAAANNHRVSRNLGEIGTIGGLTITAELFPMIGKHEPEARLCIGDPENSVTILASELRNQHQVGSMMRLENALGRLDVIYTKLLDRIQSTETDIERAHIELGKPFTAAEELAAARERMARVETEMAARAKHERSQDAPTPDAETSTTPDTTPQEGADPDAAGDGLSLVDMAMHDALVMAGMNPATARAEPVEPADLPEFLRGIITPTALDNTEAVDPDHSPAASRRPSGLPRGQQAGQQGMRGPADRDGDEPRSDSSVSGEPSRGSSQTVSASESASYKLHASLIRDALGVGVAAPIIADPDFASLAFVLDDMARRGYSCILLVRDIYEKAGRPEAIGAYQLRSATARYPHLAPAQFSSAAESAAPPAATTSATGVSTADRPPTRASIDRGTATVTPTIPTSATGTSTSPSPSAPDTGRVLRLHHSAERGTILLGTDKSDNIRSVFQKWRNRGFATGAWNWSSRIENGTRRAGAWYLPKTRGTCGEPAADHIGRSVRALRDAGHTVHVDIDLQGLSEAAQNRLRKQYPDVLASPSESESSTTPSNTAPAPAPSTHTESATQPGNHRSEPDDLRSRSRQLLATATRTASGSAGPNGWTDPDPEFEPPPDTFYECEGTYDDAGTEF